jgi:multimeric flavodoxin WrbA
LNIIGEKMKVTIINGSPRINGATGKILTKIKEILASKQDTEISYFNLNAFNMRYCIGCYKCYSNGGCIIKDDGLEELSKTIMKSDMLIIGSPTYAENFHSLLKNVIDRCHFVLEQNLDNIYCFAVTTYANIGGKTVLKKLKNLFTYSGGIYCGEFVIKLPFNSDPFKDEKISDKLIKKTEKSYKKAREKKVKSITEKIKTGLIRNIGMKKLILKDPNHGYLKKLWIEKGYL